MAGVDHDDNIPLAVIALRKHRFAGRLLSRRVFVDQIDYQPMTIFLIWRQLEATGLHIGCQIKDDPQIVAIPTRTSNTLDRTAVQIEAIQSYLQRGVLDIDNQTGRVFQREY